MRNTFLTVPIVSALGLTLNESASDAMVGNGNVDKGSGISDISPDDIEQPPLS